MHGNAALDRVTHNALSILTAIGRTDVPVYAGACKPFMRPPVHAPAIHGESGIDGTSLLPEPTVSPQPGNAFVAMRNAIMATPPQTSVLVATGTLTNVALLLATFPEVVTHLREVSLMGGAFASRADAKGNIKPWAEFNIYGDPEAARCLLSDPRLSDRITIVPLDLTHSVLATPHVLARLRGGPGPGTGSTLRTMLFELLTYFSDTYMSVFGITAGPPLHDPLAVAAVLPTDEIAWQMDRVRVHVVCHGKQLGKTTADRAPESSPEPDALESSAAAAVPRVGLGGGVHQPQEVHTMVKVPRAVDVDAFWDVLLGLVAQADGRYSWPAERAD